MRDDYWFAHYGRVGVYWHLGHFGLAQIGAYVGSPLRQNRKTRVPKRCNIRLHYSKKKKKTEASLHKIAVTLSLISSHCLRVPSINPRSWSVD
jgi:hypothetical protein